MVSTSKRTKKGNVTATARKKYGNKQGKFPVFDHKSAMSALRLRNHGDGVSEESVINRVRNWAMRNHDQAVLDKINQIKKS